MGNALKGQVTFDADGQNYTLVYSVSRAGSGSICPAPRI